MPRLVTPRALLAFATSSAFALLLGASSAGALAQTVTLSNGTGSCNFTGASYTAATNTWTFTCASGGGATTATMSFGPVSGSLSTTGASSATIGVSCAGACAGLTSAASVTSPAGVTASGVISSGAGTITVSSTGALAAGNAVVHFTAPTGAAGGVSVTPTTAIDVNVPITTPVSSTLGFAAPSATAIVGDPAVSINIARSVAASEAASVAFSCVDALVPSTYGPPMSPGGRGTFYWGPGDNSVRTISITPVALPTGVSSGSVTCTLNSPSGAGLGVASFTLSINAQGANNNCPAVPNVTLSPLGEKTRELGMGGVSGAGMGSTAIKFSPSRHGKSQGFTTATMPASGYPSAYNFATEFAIAECPGVFTSPQWQCTQWSAGTNAMQIDWKTTAAGSAWACTLDPAKDYYVNIRFVDAPNGASSCQSAACAAYVDFTYQ